MLIAFSKTRNFFCRFRQHGVLRNQPRACDQRFFGYALLRSTDDPLGDDTYSFGTNSFLTASWGDDKKGFCGDFRAMYL